MPRKRSQSSADPDFIDCPMSGVERPECDLWPTNFAYNFTWKPDGTYKGTLLSRVGPEIFVIVIWRRNLKENLAFHQEEEGRKVVLPLFPRYNWHSFSDSDSWVGKGT